MIKMIRIDDRLLHGQVVFMWSKSLDVKGIIVANDALVNDPIQIVAMKMTVPDHIKLLIKNIDDAITLLHDPRVNSMQILVVVENPVDAARVLKGIDSNLVSVVNIGNSGRIKKGNKRVLTKEVYIDDEDIAAMKEILAYDKPFEIQMIPTNNKVNVKDALMHFEKEDK